ncbi:filamentous hemagglutinin N-terminal domain-containing protein [Variovorax sp. Sphag1AA]|uniref:two-partner secretion domain-containing protein n=1 Tax=Variovorax sp. Sphag1AA TaxID=2587027 RepID=UPI001616B67A|nr:filamentous hemagglutinin N-terminal domain-containing protein [Variovorax sp. Sphag1AA]MBB3179963.1 filamentous hemagglutinin family protein [Variovorax sp. Sphag1AA]
MNKNLHKVIFCAARSMRVAVQECARSAGKGANRTTSGSNAITTAITTGMGLVAIFASMSASAQIVASPSAPGNQHPTVLMAPNGVPLVQIATPSAAGVSRNTYSQFDIQNNGAILNNSRANVQTQLGGWVQGNPWLATGTARVIVNEVVSGNPTQLRGALEVAGDRAEVIVANPAGIAVNGGSFLNASRVTLTTGTPQYNLFGGLDGYAVRGGNVSVDGKGLDLSQTDYAAVLARAVQVNAGIWAKDLKVVTGANDISADHTQVAPAQGSGAAPAFALDVAALGGMYANHIFLMGTENGVGVRNAGAIQASANSTSGAAATLAGAGQFIVTSAGRLETSGTLQADTQLRIDAASVANSGTIAAGTDLHIASSAGDLANGGLVQAPHLDLSSSAQIDNRLGTIRQTGSASLTVSAPSLSNTAGGTIGLAPVADNSSGAGSTPGTGTSDTSPNSGAGSAPSSTTPPSTAGTNTGATPAPQPVAPPTPGTLTASTAILNDGGHIEAGGALVLATPQINNAGGRLAIADLAVTGPNFSNAGGELSVKAVISTAINGGSLEEALKEGLKGALVDTVAAQGANAIGDMNLDEFTNKIAHAIAGCAVGAARTDGSCAAGALGAAVGEMAAEAYGRQIDTVQFAAMMSAIAAAIAGGDATQINLASQAGANAAANNYLSHSPFASVRELVAKENARLTEECGQSCTAEDFQRIDQQAAAVERAANLAEVAKRGVITPDQAQQLAQALLEIAPVYGTAESALQLITGRTSLTGEEANRILAAVGLVPIAGGVVRKVGEPVVETLTSVLRALDGPVFKTTHYATRLEAEGVNVARAEAAVAKEVAAMWQNMEVGGSVSGRLRVDGVQIEYRVRVLPDGTANVGTIFPVK